MFTGTYEEWALDLVVASGVGSLALYAISCAIEDIDRYISRRQTRRRLDRLCVPSAGAGTLRTDTAQLPAGTVGPVDGAGMRELWSPDTRDHAPRPAAHAVLNLRERAALQRASERARRRMTGRVVPFGIDGGAA